MDISSTTSMTWGKKAESKEALAKALPAFCCSGVALFFIWSNDEVGAL